MAADGGHRILSRMAGLGAEAKTPEPPVTPARVLRRAVARAGEALQLALGVATIADGVHTLDQILAELDETLLILALTEAGIDRGFVILDLAVRDALVEVQTLGALSSRPSPQGGRPVTAADAALAVPFLERILNELSKAGPGTDLPDWIGATAVAGRFGSRRVIAATLPAGNYRTVALGIDLGAPGREGRLKLVLPPPGVARRGSRAEESAQWAEAFRSGVLDASAVLTAVLTRHRLSLAEAEALRPGQVLPLPGVTVGSVRLEAPVGQPLAAARLGQFAGLRAVRLELPKSPHLRETWPGLGAVAPGFQRIAGQDTIDAESSFGAPDPWAGTDGLVEAEPAPLPPPDWPTGETTGAEAIPPDDDGPAGPFDAAPAEGRGELEAANLLPDSPADATTSGPAPARADAASAELSPLRVSTTDGSVGEDSAPKGRDQAADAPPEVEPPALEEQALPQTGATETLEDVFQTAVPSSDPVIEQPSPASPSVPRRPGPLESAAEEPGPVFARFSRKPAEAAAGLNANGPTAPRAAPFALDDEPGPEVDANGDVTPGSEIAVGLDMMSLGIEESD